MKAGRLAAAAAIASGVTAQSSLPVSYTTVTYDVCPTSVVQSLVTVTNGVTVTYCPECEHGNLPPTTAPGTTHTTVYTTTYLSVCPTSGTVPATYTVTETCVGPTPTWNTSPDHIPQDFTVTVQTCNVCGPTPVPVTVTQPCGCKATEGVPIPQPNPKPTAPAGPSMGPGCPGPNCQSPSSPAGGNMPGCPGPNCQSPSSPAGGNMPGCPGGPNCPGGSNNGPSSAPGSGPSSGPGCPGPNCKGNNASPNPPASGPGCPGPQCQMGPTGSAGTAQGSKPTPTPSSGTGCPGGPNCPATPKTTYAGAASQTYTIGMASSLLVAVVAAFAFGL